MVGCDSVLTLYDTGKAKVINALKSVILSVFGNPKLSEAEYIGDPKRFIARNYDTDNRNSSENR